MIKLHSFFLLSFSKGGYVTIGVVTHFSSHSQSSERGRACSLKIETSILLLHGGRMESGENFLCEAFTAKLLFFTWGRFFHRWRLVVLDLLRFT